MIAATPNTDEAAYERCAEPATDVLDAVFASLRLLSDGAWPAAGECRAPGYRARRDRRHGWRGVACAGQRADDNSSCGRARGDTAHGHLASARRRRRPNDTPGFYGGGRDGGRAQVIYHYHARVCGRARWSGGWNMRPSPTPVTAPTAVTTICWNRYRQAICSANSSGYAKICAVN